MVGVCARAQPKPMPNLNPKRFTQHDILRRIDPECLLAWLRPSADFFTSRGLALPPEIDGKAGFVMGDGTKGLDFEKLSEIFVNPDEEMPPELVDSLSLIHEMADANGMDAILEAVKARGLDLEAGDNPDPADVAVRAWLLDRNLLEEIHTKYQLMRPRSFTYYASREVPLPAFSVPSPAALRALEKRLETWYAESKRGRRCQVRAFPKDGECWFLVRHGLPCKREGVMDENGTGSVFYRPQKHDVVVYNEARGELRVNCCGLRELAQFLVEFGICLFGNDQFFPEVEKYSYSPLFTGRACLECGDVPGIEEVKWREVEVYFKHNPWQRVTRKGADLFELLDQKAFELPSVTGISRAGFEVRFGGSRKTRRVTIIGRNKAQYGRDDDSLLVERWLKLRGFVTNGGRLEA